MNFNSKVIGAYWQDDTSEWKVDIEQTLPDGTTRVSEERCHVLLYGTGILNNYKWPKVDGLDRFEGKVSHGTVAVVRASRMHVSNSTTPDRSYSELAPELPGRAVE